MAKISKLDKITKELIENINEAILKLDKLEDNQQATDLREFLAGVLEYDLLKSEDEYENYEGSYYDSWCSF